MFQEISEINKAETEDMSQLARAVIVEGEAPESEDEDIILQTTAGTRYSDLNIKNYRKWAILYWYLRIEIIWTSRNTKKLLHQMTDCSYDCLDWNNAKPNINWPASLALDQLTVDYLRQTEQVSAT